MVTRLTLTLLSSGGQFSDLKPVQVKLSCTERGEAAPGLKQERMLRFCNGLVVTIIIPAAPISPRGQRFEFARKVRVVITVLANIRPENQLQGRAKKSGIAPHRTCNDSSGPSRHII